MADKNAVRLMQEALNQIHHLDAGPEDGLWGKRSAAAYGKYLLKLKGIEEPKVEWDNQEDNHINGMVLSQAAVDLIVENEVSSRAYYNKLLRYPTWPKGASGVTVGIGFDLGYNTREQIRESWEGNATDAELQVLMSCAGIRGKAAYEKTREIKNMVDIGWDEAVNVFEKSTLPRYVGYTRNTFTGVEKLHPTIQGVIVSLVFNRGASLSGARRKEMKNIRDHIANGSIHRIPAEIRSMKRLWVGKGLDGLLKRREQEAKLVESVL